MKIALSAFALCGIVFAASAHADERLVGEWQLVKISCEGGKVLKDQIGLGKWKIFDKVSLIAIQAYPETGDLGKNCKLHAKTNYQVNGNRYTIGPFLELSSPKCPMLAKAYRKLMNYSEAHMKEKGVPDWAIKTVTSFGTIKKGIFSPVEFTIRNNNRRFDTYVNGGSTCPGARVVKHYEKVK